MQLADQSSTQSLISVSKTLMSADRVLRLIKYPQTVFRGVARVVSDDLPLTQAACNDRPISKLNEAKRMGLKLTLAEDLSPVLAEVDAAVDSEKRFNAELLPSEPVACVARIDELRAEVKRKISDLQQELEMLDGAEHAIQTLQRVQTQAGKLAAELGNNKRQCLAAGSAPRKCL